MLSFKNRVCPRWLNGKKCPFSADQCFFKHTKDFMPLCQKWVDGQCIGGHGNSCSSRHYYMETDKTTNQQAAPTQPVESVLSQFSSPLVQRNIKETKKLRRIHVDIETGCEKSFTEEITEDIVDLTGQVTPVRPAAKFFKKNLENIDPEKLGEENESTKNKDEDLSKNEKNKTKEENRENDNQKENNVNNNPAVLKEGECRFCLKQFKGIIGLRSHLARNKLCGKKCKEEKRKSNVQKKADSSFSVSLNCSVSSVDSVSTTNQILTSTPATSKPNKSKVNDGSLSTSSFSSSSSTPRSTRSMSRKETQSIIEIIDDSEINGSTIVLD